MKKFICIIISLVILNSLSITSMAANNTNYDEKGNISTNEKVITKLFDERQKLFFEESVDLKKLNEIDFNLHSLGVDFLTLEEVDKQFPEAKAQREKVLTGNTGTESPLNQNVTPYVVAPDSSVNTWASYRTVGYYYGGSYYNIQKLVAQPINNKSALWENGERTVSFSVNWKAGVTNLITSLAYSAAGTIASTPITVYDALSSVWSGLKTVSDVNPSDVTYKWRTQTTAVFSYVKPEGKSDSYQSLSHISTKCLTSVGYLAAIDSWRQNGSGAWVLYPYIKSSSKYLEHIPSGYNDTFKAVWAYINVSGGSAYHDCVDKIKISGPESKSVQTIYPCYPQFPLQCE